MHIFVKRELQAEKYDYTVYYILFHDIPIGLYLYILYMMTKERCVGLSKKKR